MKKVTPSVFLEISPLHIGHLLSQLNSHHFPCLVLSTYPQAVPNPDLAAEIIIVGTMCDSSSILGICM